MDPLDDYLATVRAHGSLFVQSVCSPPWGLRFDEPRPLMLLALADGAAWIVPGRGAPLRFEAGEIALVRGGFTVGDSPDVTPGIVIDGENRCYAAGDDPASAGDRFKLGTRTYGTPGGSSLLITAAYSMRGGTAGRVLDVLPPALTVPAGDDPVLGMLTGEIAKDEPGQQTVLDRLLDLLLIRVLRTWFADPGTRAPAGYRALADPAVGHALRLIHQRPDQGWTVASLAAAAGLSRASFARRFTALVGEPPLAYLTAWRMTLAADLLTDSGAGLGSIARQVGYADAFAFSVAFKRIRGVPPSAVRAGSPGA
ncbi:AraC family transcriptional regulator [Amycolatopsis sp. YIM 10]|uniref:AraC family transcriptional regulator n=1 Tax=Amycolatopsis sp. YIM 10 TaxID=2653857 RepID=UPI00129070C1|nr:AraC family transcriptional regulator [Amycolatopsis sp. YIM 10]QFU90144.1 HTH-type transcriptional activator Btr [Amycolatopsis sp. YIM 10]